MYCLTFDDEEDGVKPESLMCPLMFSDGLGLMIDKRGVGTRIVITYTTEARVFQHHQDENPEV